MEILNNILGLSLASHNRKRYLVNFHSRKFMLLDSKSYEYAITHDDGFLEQLAYEGFLDEYSVQNRISKAYNPITGTFLMTTKCNLCCEYCYAKNNLNEELCFSTASIAVDFLIKNALDRNEKSINIRFHGAGEPTMNFSVLKEISDYTNCQCNKYGINATFHLTTNGIFSDEYCNWIVHNINVIVVSFDGFEVIQNKQRPHPNLNSYNEVLKTIKILVKEERKPIIRTTVTGENMDFIPDWVIFLSSIGITQVNIEPAIFYDTNAIPLDESFNWEQFMIKFLYAKKIVSKAGTNVCFSGVDIKNQRHYHCGGYGSNFVITANGLISTCYEAFDKNNPYADYFIIGNISNCAVQINHHKLVSHRETGLNYLNSCNNCIAKTYCAGGCLYKRIQTNLNVKSYVYEKCHITRQLLLYELGAIIDQMSSNLEPNCVYDFFQAGNSNSKFFYL